MPWHLLAASLLQATTPTATESPAAPAPPVARPEPPIAEPWIVFFDFDSARVTPGAAAILDHMILNYRAAGGAAVEITGYADLAGPAAYNLRLSRRRARAVAAYLVQRGIPRVAITTRGFGETAPLLRTRDNVPEPQNRYAVIAVPPPVLR